MKIVVPEEVGPGKCWRMWNIIFHSAGGCS